MGGDLRASHFSIANSFTIIKPVSLDEMWW
jgi:hypothetical protein